MNSPLQQVYRDDAAHFVSLGAGRQSKAMVLMAAHGLIKPMPTAAIFADTGGEPSWVYDTVRELQGYTLPFPVIVTRRGNLSDDLLAGDDMARIPAFVEPTGLAGRQCTRNYKIRPVRKEIRRFLGVSDHGYLVPGSVVQWQGISTNEADRMKPTGAQYLVNRWPLIELGFSVSMCLEWLGDHGYPVPRSSACTYCPLVPDSFRRQIRDDDPGGWQRALALDREMRTPGNIARFRGKLYIHPSRVPLEQVDLDKPSPQMDLFSNECEGMCGV